MDKPDYCRTCPLYNVTEGFAVGEGNPDADVLFLGESLGEHEVREGRPFKGGAGRILTKLIIEAGSSRALHYIHNCINCRPPSNKLELLPTGDVEAALKHCSAYWHRTVREVKPKVIVTLGNYALKAVTGQWGIMARRGYVWDVRIEDHYCKVVAAIHPIALVRGERMQVYWGLTRDDFRKAIELARDGAPLYEERFVTEPTLSQVLFLVNGFDSPRLHEPGPPVYIDIEWEGGCLLCVGLAWSESDALCIPFWRSDDERYWSPEELEQVVGVVDQVLAGPRPKRFHYGGTADIPTLEKVGFKVNNWDGDTAAKHHLLYAELPRRLGSVASTHASMPYWKDMIAEDKAVEEAGK